MKKKYDFSGLRRREFMAAMAGVSAMALFKNPLVTLVDAVASGVMQRATANGSVNLGNEYRYVSIIMGQAPARWAWDNFLTPKSDSVFEGNQSVKNAFNLTPSIEQQYASWDYTAYPGSIRLPALWGTSLPLAGGGSLPDYSNLLQNAIMVRGIDVGADLGHDDGPNRAIQPSPGAPGLHGLMADNSKFPIPLVGMHDGHVSHGFEATGSQRGIAAAPVLVTQDGAALNPLENFLGRFLMTAEQNNDGTNVSIESIELLTQATLNKIGDHQKSRIGTDAINQNLTNTEALVRTSIQTVIAEFPTVYTKYLNLMKDSSSPLSTVSKIVGGPDKSVELISSAHVDSNAVFSNVTLGQSPSTTIAANFAVTEILLKNSLSGSISFGLDSSIHPLGMGAGKPSYFLDEHSTSGDLAFRNSTLNFMYRALSASINELKTVLIANHTWDKTTIHCASEFGRCGISTPGNLGSDHAPNATSVTIFSGRINSFMPIGNIRKTNSDFANLIITDGKYNGTWGAAAPVDFGQNQKRIIGYHHVANTVADLIGVERVANGPSLIEKSGDSFVKGVADEPTNFDT